MVESLPIHFSHPQLHFSPPISEGKITWLSGEVTKPNYVQKMEAKLVREMHVKSRWPIDSSPACLKKKYFPGAHVFHICSQSEYDGALEETQVCRFSRVLVWNRDSLDIWIFYPHCNWTSESMSHRSKNSAMMPTVRALRISQTQTWTHGWWGPPTQFSYLSFSL